MHAHDCEPGTRVRLEGSLLHPEFLNATGKIVRYVKSTGLVKIKLDYKVGYQDTYEAWPHNVAALC